MVNLAFSFGRNIVCSTNHILFFVSSAGNEDGTVTMVDLRVNGACPDDVNDICCENFDPNKSPPTPEKQVTMCGQRNELGVGANFQGFNVSCFIPSFSEMLDKRNPIGLHLFYIFLLLLLLSFKFIMISVLFGYIR